MDVFDTPYYRLNKIFLSCLGQWPYQPRLQKYLIRTALGCALVSITVPEILRVIEVWGELDYVIDCISILSIQLAIAMKMLNYVFNADKIKILMDRMKNDWETEMYASQLKILKDYANEGKKLTEIYCIYMFTTLASYLFLPLMPVFLDIVMPLNESRPAVYLIPVKYGNLDPYEYYYLITLHANCVATIAMTSIVAMDTTYVVYVQHACGIFTILGDRLEHLMETDSNEQPNQINAEEQEEATYRAIIVCIKMHKEAIEFASIIETSHVIMYFFVIGMSILCMSVAGYQMVMNLDKPNEAIRFATFIIAQVAHIFFISWPGQKLIDHSERMYEWIYGGKWYQVSTRSNRLLMIMMLRSLEPCKLTAGKLYVMSLPNFSMIVRTSVSYFTVLTSFR